MACGCCVVGSRGMPVEEVIQDGVNGILVPILEHGLIAQRILSLLACSHLRDQLGIQARRTALNWDEAVTLPKLTALIEAG